VVSSSSTKKAARLAKKGKGKRVRFQGGTLFPMVVLAILVIGLAVIVYARATVPAADASPPTAEDHWHMAYGFSLCDEPEMRRLNGNLEDPAGENFNDYNRTGVHSHDDGVIHWHPFTSASVGKNATLGLFLENYGVELDNNSLKFPDDQLEGREYVEDETECPDGEDGELSVTVWSSPEDTSDGRRYVTNFDDIRMDKDSLVITIAFQPKGTDIEMPPWAADLEALGAIDTGQTQPGDTTGSSTTVSGGTTAPGATATPGTGVTTTVVGEPSAAATTAPTATTAAPAAVTTAAP
jgi:hypothetical protein